MDLHTPLSQIWVLMKRSFRMWTTYKLMVVTGLLNVAIGIVAWGVMATYRNRTVPEYGTDYISFLITGIVIANVVMPMSRGLDRFNSPLNPWMLESVMMTGIRAPVLIAGAILWNLFFYTTTLIPQLLIAIYWFNARLNVNLLSTTLSLIISMTMLFSLNMAAVGTRFVTKTVDPISWVSNLAGQLLAGMLFPVQYLDEWIPGLTRFTWLLPHTWVYHLIRSGMLNNASITDPTFLFDFLMGGMYAAILFPMGLYVFRWGLKRAKREGTLGWF